MNGAMLVGPGSTAATARADIGARQARREAWVWGCEQFSDDARHVMAIDLVEEFALFGAPGR